MTVTSLTLGTWNILGRRDYRADRVAEPGAVADTLRGQSLDVLSLQEIHFFSGQPDPQLIQELEQVGLRHFVGLGLSESHLDRAAQLGVGIASRHPLSRRDAMQLTRPDLRASVRGKVWVLHDKGMVGCALDVGGGRPLWVYSLHLFPFFEFGVTEDDDLVEGMWREFWGHADKLAGHGDVVLAGDFNHQQRESAAQRWSRRQWWFCLGTQRTTFNGHSLDEIALSWPPPAAGTTTLVPTFSDHYLVIADVQLRTDAAPDRASRGELRRVWAG